MCNIQLGFNKTNWIQSFFIVLLTGLLFSSCEEQLQFNKELDRAIAERNAPEILNYANHEDEQIAHHAIRALQNTPIHLDTLLNFVINSDDPYAFKALYRKDLKFEQIAKLRKFYGTATSDQRYELAQVFRLLEDSNSFKWLIATWYNESNKGVKRELAFAISWYAKDFGLQPDTVQYMIVEEALSDQMIHIPKYMYGFYRSNKRFLTNGPDSLIVNFIKNNGHFIPAKVMQYLINPLSKKTHPFVVQYLKSIDMTEIEPTLQVEFVQAFSRYLPTPDHQEVMLNLLNSRNELVLETIFTRISQAYGWTKSVLDKIENLNIKSTRISLMAKVFLSKSGRVQTISSKEIVELTKTEPLALSEAMNLAQLSFTPKEQVDLLMSVYDTAPTAAKGSIISKLIQPLRDLSYFNKRKLEPAIKSFLSEVIKDSDRSAMIELNTILTDKILQKYIDETELFNLLAMLDPSQDIEVFQTYMSFILAKGTQSESLIDRLIKSNQSAIYESLRSKRYAKSLPVLKTRLAIPNRTRLMELGVEPIWVWETNKGEIHFELDIKRCPTTVWLIDSLTTNGFFNNVPFHRVIPNFVAQGGDFERNDGYGGSNTIIPTEASDLTFERGALGMASAGTDTESAQFFVMHMWKPHLDGRYTRFGKVVKGFDLVDKWVIGDKILKAKLEMD